MTDTETYQKIRQNERSAVASIGDAYEIFEQAVAAAQDSLSYEQAPFSPARSLAERVLGTLRNNMALDISGIESQYTPPPSPAQVTPPIVPTNQTTE